MLAQQKMKAYYDKHTQEPDFTEGQKVWVYTPRTYKKLLHNYHGPYRVVEKLSPVHYRLRTCRNKPVSSILHANRMKHFVDPNDRPIEPPVGDIGRAPWLTDTDLPEDSFHPSQPIEAPSAPHDITVDDQNSISQTLIDNETVYNAEKLLKQRTVNGQAKYLVKWAGFPISDATWQPETNILDPRLLENFRHQAA